MKKTLFIELQHLPSVAYFALLHQTEEILIDSEEIYKAQTLRNRCKILGPNKVLELSVPVRNARKGLLYKEIQIDYNQKWLNVHWRSIVSSYGKSPFFEYYIDFFEKVYYNGYENLFDFNKALLECCIKILGLKLNIRYQKIETEELKIAINYKNKLAPNVDYFEVTKLKEVEYHQVFGKEFVQGLSILDLIFCEGPNAINILKESLVK